MSTPTDTPNLATRFFRILIKTGMVASCVVIVIAAIADYHTTRNHLIDDFREMTNHAVNAYGFLYTHKKTELLESYLLELTKTSNVSAICAYNAQNHSITNWHEADNPPCPAILDRAGIKTDTMRITMATKVEVAGNYIGMIYTQGKLFSLSQFLLHLVVISATLLLIAVATCKFASLRCAAFVNRSLLEIYEYTGQLKANNAISCPVLQVKEIKELAKTITDLHQDMKAKRITFAHFDDTRNWHLDLISTLVTLIASHTRQGSPLLDYANDYELLVQIERGSRNKMITTFNLEEVLARAIANVKKEFTFHRQINFTASLQAGIPMLWKGDDEMLETLLRHLLLISLRRTSSGFVFLRLESSHPKQWMQAPSLSIKLEDSGSAVQPWQLKQWLDTGFETPIPLNNIQEISWILVTRLAHAMGGSGLAESPASGGLTYTALLPFAFPDTYLPPSAAMEPETPHQDVFPLKILLMVATQSPHQQALNELLESKGYRIFKVSSNAKALEIAPVLPFSALILEMEANAALEYADRLSYQMQEGTLATLPIWVKGTAAHTSNSISAYLPRPYHPEAIYQLCNTLKPCSQGFYHSVNAQIRLEMPPASLLSLPSLNAMLANQINELLPTLEMLSHADYPSQATHQIHAVKSAALTLGYFRLAALMGEMEYAILHRSFNSYPENWGIIGEILATIQI